MAGAIKTGPVTREYEAGWERAFGAGGVEPPVGLSDVMRGEAVPGVSTDDLDAAVRAAFLHEDSDELEEAVGGDADAGVEVERAVARTETAYDCPRCGWHLRFSSDRCGNATCRMSRR